MTQPYNRNTACGNRVDFEREWAGVEDALEKVSNYHRHNRFATKRDLQHIDMWLYVLIEAASEARSAVAEMERELE